MLNAEPINIIVLTLLLGLLFEVAVKARGHRGRSGVEVIGSARILAVIDSKPAYGR